MTDSGPVPIPDTTVPSPARMYDYYLGGKDNYQVDRDAAEVALDAHPSGLQVARNNRAFLTRAVRYMVAEGEIDQLVDLGSGMPTSPTPHETARDVRPGTRVAYVDEDPIVLAHGRALAERVSGIGVVGADVFDPEAVLSDAALTEVIDLSRPVGLLGVAVFHFCPDDRLYDVLAGYRDRLAPGSWVAFSAGTTEGLDPGEIRALEDAYRRASRPLRPRPRPQIEAMFEGYTLAEPGIVDVAQWRGDGQPAHLVVLAGVGRLGT